MIDFYLLQKDEMFQYTATRDGKLRVYRKNSEGTACAFLEQDGTKWKHVKPHYEGFDLEDQVQPVILNVMPTD